MSTGTILLVEDDLDDVFLVKRAFQEAGITNPLAVVHDGLEALEYLNAEGRYSLQEPPSMPILVLLDLDLPFVNGFDLLAKLRRHSRFAKLPVVVLTTSALSPDVSRAYRLGANSFITKPADIEHLKTMLKEVIRFWAGPHGHDDTEGTSMPKTQQTHSTIRST